MPFSTCPMSCAIQKEIPTEAKTPLKRPSLCPDIVRIRSTPVPFKVCENLKASLDPQPQPLSKPHNTTCWCPQTRCRHEWETRSLPHRNVHQPRAIFRIASRERLEVRHVAA